MESNRRSGSAGAEIAPILTVGSEPEEYFVEAGPERRWPLVVLLLILAAIIGVLAAIGQSVRSEPEPAAPPESSVVREDATGRSDIEPTRLSPVWPDPPDDHPPIVIGAPSSGGPLAADPPGHTLVYINSIDRPTVIDLVRGGRQEISISEERARDRFLVEDGHVVDNDPLNTDLPTASVRAIPVIVHRSALTNTVDLSESLPYSGLHLCLDMTGCDGSWRYSSSLRSAGQLVTRVSVDSHEVLQQMFNPENSAIVGRFSIVVGPTGAEVKVPVLRAGSPIWLISDLDDVPVS